LIVYIGAILVLFLFVVMMVDLNRVETYSTDINLKKSNFSKKETVYPILFYFILLIFIFINRFFSFLPYKNMYFMNDFTFLFIFNSYKNKFINHLNLYS